MTLLNKYNPPTALLERVYTSPLFNAQPGSEASHIVQPGDTLQSLAKSYYGDTQQWIRIFSANGGMFGGGVLPQPGQILKIPHG